ncbi:MAG: FG-GAP repeat domain-containing protein [Terriglobales bacterium]
MISSTPATNPWPQSIAVADFNGDGKLDLAVPVYSIFTPLTDVNILLGNGDGTFTAGPAFPLTGQNVNNAVVADFNGDGKPDLAISLPDANEIQVLLGNGDGTFTPMPAISANGVFVVATGDFNRDGKADLVTVNCGPGTLTILLGNGDGTFTEGATITTPVTGPGGLAVCPVSVAVGDFNRDGIPDLAVANCPRFDQGATGSATVLLGNGDGTFTAEAESPDAGGQPLFITTGDFNGDGIPDLVVSDMNSGYPELGNLTVLLGNGDGTFTPTAVSPQTGSIPYSVAVADFNGDGKADLAIANAGSNTISVLLGNGDGTFAAPLNVAAGADPVFATVGDFNGDGLPDLAAANNTTSSVTILLTKH